VRQHHFPGDVQLLAQVGHELFRFDQIHYAGHANSFPGGIGRKSSPAWTHLEDAIAGLEFARVETEIEFAHGRVFERFIIVEKNPLSVTTRLGILKGLVEVRIEIVMGMDGFGVGADLSEEQWMYVTPDAIERMKIGK